MGNRYTCKPLSKLARRKHSNKMRLMKNKKDAELAGASTSANQQYDVTTNDNFDSIIVKLEPVDPNQRENVESANSAPDEVVKVEVDDPLSQDENVGLAEYSESVPSEIVIKMEEVETPLECSIAATIDTSNFIILQNNAVQENICQSDVVPHRDLTVMQPVPMEPNNEFTPISGARIVNINYFFENLKKKIVRHSEVKGCSIQHIDLVGEKRSGILSKFKFECNQCHTKFFIDSDDPKKFKT